MSKVMMTMSMRRRASHMGLIVALIGLVASLSACQGKAQQDAGDVDGTARATVRAQQTATARARLELQQTTDALATQQALPTATATPIGQVFDGGDGLITSLMRNIAVRSGVGESVGSPELAEGHAHNYLFSADAGIYVIGVSSRGADPKFVVFGPSGDVILAVDNVQGSLDARSVVSLPVAGVYTIRVSGNKPGGYALSLMESSAFQADVVWTGADGRATVDIIALSLPLQNEIRAWVAGPQEAVNVSFINEEASRSLQFRVEGVGAADPAIVLIDPQGNVVASDDNSGGGVVAEITTSLAAAGRYTLRVTVNQAVNSSDTLRVTVSEVNSTTN